MKRLTRFILNQVAPFYKHIVPVQLPVINIRFLIVKIA